MKTLKDARIGETVIVLKVGGEGALKRRKFYEALPTDEEIKKYQGPTKVLKESTDCLSSKGTTLH